VREDLFDYLKAGDGESVSSPTDLLAPIDSQEVWAAGVTYFRSRTARMAESKETGGGDFYDRVYLAERPEVFFKANPHRVVGTGAAVRIRSDSQWNVPEPELTLLISPQGQITGYTVGNDMSSRDIEGENPLYLPQAKVYDQCCALGPAVWVNQETPKAETEIGLRIFREGAVAFEDTTTLAAMKRKPEELVQYLYREASFPNGAFLMTGTGIVPPDTFTLASGDRVDISISGIGTLSNPVERRRGLNT
jgi:2-dehydro-3-deoxy-D-arabinonate dehydratase